MCLVSPGPISLQGPSHPVCDRTHGALWVQLTADIASEDRNLVLRASGSQLLFDGWLRAWSEPLAGASRLSETTEDSSAVDADEDVSGKPREDSQGEVLVVRIKIPSHVPTVL